MAVLACNTATATELRRLQQTRLPSGFLDRRVIGVVVPAVEEITGAPQSIKVHAEARDIEPVRHVAVFATQHTVNSQAYVVETQSRNPAIQVHQRACPGLVTLIDWDCPRSVAQDQNRRARWIGACVETIDPNRSVSRGMVN